MREFLMEFETQRHSEMGFCRTEKEASTFCNVPRNQLKLVPCSVPALPLVTF